MASIARKIEKRIAARSGQGEVTTFARKVANGGVTRRINPESGELQDFHFTKGWR